MIDDNMQASVAAEARKGAENGLCGITSKANEALDVEVTKARQTIGEVAEDLRVRAWGKSLKWVAGSLTVGFVLGFVLCWFMWGRNARDAVKRFDSINAQLQRLYNQHGEPVSATPPAAKPPRQNQHPHMQQRSQVNAPAPSEVPEEQP